MSSAKACIDTLPTRDPRILDHRWAVAQYLAYSAQGVLFFIAFSHCQQIQVNFNQFFWIKPRCTKTNHNRFLGLA